MIKTAFVCIAQWVYLFSSACNLGSSPSHALQVYISIYVGSYSWFVIIAVYFSQAKTNTGRIPENSRTIPDTCPKQPFRLETTLLAICAEPLGSNIQTYGVVLTLIEQGWLTMREDRQVSEEGERTWMQQKENLRNLTMTKRSLRTMTKLTWLVLGGDPAARSHRVEQFTALWGL